MFRVTFINTFRDRTAAWLAALLVIVAVAAPAAAADPAKELGTKLQKSKSRMMGMQFDQAATLFQEATALLDQLKSSDPDHKDLPKLQKNFDKLATARDKKMTQRAERDIKPMMSTLETALRGSDRDKIRQAREKLAGAIAKHKDNLTAVGGPTGAAALASAQAAIDEADAAMGAAPAKQEDKPAQPAAKPTSTPPTGGGDPKQLNSEIQRKFRGARDLRTPELVKLAVEIRRLIGELRAADPANPNADKYDEKINRMVSVAYAADVKTAKGEIDRRIGKINMYLERNQENERPQLQEQRKLLEEVLATHRAALEAAGPDGEELIAETEATLKSVDTRISGALAGDSLVNEWIEKLGAYRRDGAKDITPGINGAALFARIKRLRAEADQVWAEYQQVEFADGKTSELESAEERFTRALAEADRQLEYAVSSRLEEARGRIKRIADMFAGDQAWKTDKNSQPKRFADELLEQAGSKLDDFAGYAPDHPELEQLRQQHQQLCQENAARRKSAMALTFLKADKYKGGDADELMAFARKLVPKTHEGAEVLRLTIFTEDWKEETVTEWTDTTHSALRTRTTRTLMFCVAFQDKEGVFRDFGYLNQNRTSGGGWGNTYGHLAKYRAPMLKENVAKDGPEEE